MLKSQLSGMPDCKFGLNDKIMLDKQTTARGDFIANEHAIT